MLYNDDQLISFSNFLINNPDLQNNSNPFKIESWAQSMWYGFGFITPHEPGDKVMLMYYTGMAPIAAVVHKVHVSRGHSRYDIDALFPDGSGERIPNVGIQHLYKPDSVVMIQYFEKTR